MSNETFKEFRLRPLEKDDENFIYNSWLIGLYYGNSWFQEIPKDIFMENYRKFLEKVLAEKEVAVIVACLIDDPSVILGYSVVNPSRKALHWVYVKEAWRRFGIAKAILNCSPFDSVTHLTAMGKRLKKKETIFNPFIV